MRIHLRKKHIISKKNIFIFTLILIFISLVFIINFIGNKITPGVVSYAETELEKFTTRIINSVISTEIKDISLEELFVITKDNNDYIKTIDYNPIVVNGVLSNITTKVDRLLRNVENGENLFEMTVVRVIENSFSYNIHIKNCDNENNLPLQMEVDKNIKKVKVGQTIKIKFEQNSVFDF